MKSLLIKIGAILCLTSTIIITLAFCYCERKFCLLRNTYTEDTKQTLYLTDEMRGKEFEIVWTYNGKHPRTKVVYNQVYVLVRHYCFIQDNYDLVFED